MASVAGSDNPGTPVRCNRTSAVAGSGDAGTTSIAASRPWSATSTASRGGNAFQTPQSTTTPSRACPTHNPSSSISHRRSDSSTRSGEPPMGGSTPWSRIRSHNVTVRPGELIRVSALAGTAAPPMVGGAPGSPGKRSGRKLSYHPVLQDERYFEYYNTWPEFLHWLQWDDRMQELSGTVPPKFGPTPLNLKLAILARPIGSGGAGAPPSPSPNSSPTKFHTRTSYGHARNGSNASNASMNVGGEEEVAAIVVLTIQKLAPTTPGAGAKYI
ncbi:hypothetical protein NDA11_001494 [Ustilago hordei]|nr:hypothetical protein NDA10_004431 [Ustilago hordei]KAJ1590655.1 hypothetical protein NDA11_001494 [Ustilago hordei]KAJ1601032.1 hypothetical protein NDA14_006268 [Ustilago hordei]